MGFEHKMMGNHLEECHVHCFSWSAVFVGALVAIGLGFLLKLFGMAIGLSTMAAATTDGGIKTFLVGGFIALLIIAVVTMFVAGWVAGVLVRPRCPTKCQATIYGFVTWCLAFVLAILLATHMNRVSNSPLQSVGLTIEAVPANAPQAPVAVTVQKPKPAEVRQVVVKEEKMMSAGLFATFIVFFVGALASCLGAHCALSCPKGMQHCRRPEDM